MIFKFKSISWMLTIFSKSSSGFEVVSHLRCRFKSVGCDNNFRRFSLTVEKRCRNVWNSENMKSISNRWISKLKRCGVPEAELSVKYIIQKVIGKAQASGDHISAKQAKMIEEMCKRRSEREPIQYIIGDWDFRYLTLILNPPVFIPRPETEELVDLVMCHHVNPCKNASFRFLEVGCGSGAICLSLLSENTKATCVAIDVNLKAVKMTKHNAVRCDVQDRLTLYHCAIGDYSDDLRFDAIISNPPYILEQHMADLEPEVLRYEDREALCGGHDGMDIIKQILLSAPHLLKPQGSVWLEMDLAHPPKVRQWLKDHLNLALYSIYDDFTQRPRFCHVVYKGIKTP